MTILNTIKSNHIIIDLCYEGKIPHVEILMDKAIEEVNELTVVDKFHHYFNPNGLSLIYILAESHISIHTWEEYNYLSIDMYTCGETSPENTLNKFLEKIPVTEKNIQKITRGI